MERSTANLSNETCDLALRCTCKLWLCLVQLQAGKNDSVVTKVLTFKTAKQNLQKTKTVH